MSIRIALLGAAGQLAADLRPLLPGSVVPLTHDDIELTDPASIDRVFEAQAFDLVINAASYNLVDRAEQQPEPAFAVNAYGVRSLAQACARRAVPLLHISTDYVFGGDSDRRTPYSESDCPAPVSVYGVSKLAGEQFVRAICPQHCIVRTCGLYGLAATRAKGNFLETMLRLAQTKPEVRVVDDQRCTPSFTEDVAAAIVALIAANARGTFHVTNSGDATWRELAEELFRQAGQSVRVTPITSAEFGAAARRPSYSVLDGLRLRAATGRDLPDWRDAVARYLKARQARPED
ncbi:MAG: dTDP-4-dehydrorhamnose reductase [Planctomyces sp.]|nr:dTDP-4-dehydrorhamnose reductase [Planctomyces sp.]